VIITSFSFYAKIAAAEKTEFTVAVKAAIGVRNPAPA